MEHKPDQPLDLAAFDLTPSPAAIHEANEMRMREYLRSLPPRKLSGPRPEPPIRRKTVPNATRWINIVNR